MHYTHTQSDERQRGQQATVGFANARNEFCTPSQPYVRTSKAIYNTAPDGVRMRLLAPSAGRPNQATNRPTTAHKCVEHVELASPSEYIRTCTQRRLFYSNGLVFFCAQRQIENCTQHIHTFFLLVKTGFSYDINIGTPSTLHRYKLTENLNDQLSNCEIIILIEFVC